MSTKSRQLGSLTNELNESVTNLLGANVKISLKCLVKIEIKADKMDTKILAFSACRLFILAAKIPTKIEQTFHYLDIFCIESKKPNQLTLSVSVFPNETPKNFTFFALDKDDIEEINLIIIQIGTAIKTIFPQVSLESIIRKIDVQPESRLVAMKKYNEALENRANEMYNQSFSESNCLKTNGLFSSSLLSPCGNFSTQYACMCDYFNLPYREEVAWDVDTIYSSHSISELSLLDFEHLETRDLIPIIAALSNNGWFRQFRASGVKLSGSSSGNKVDYEVGEQVINLIRKSHRLEEIFLDNSGIKSDFVNRLMSALISNHSSLLNTIDLSHNAIEDKGIKNLCGYVAKVAPSAHNSASQVSLHSHKGLVHLNLHRCGLSSKGIAELSDSMFLNKALSSTLTTLNLSENLMKDDCHKFFNFITQPNNIVNLDLSSTECNLDNIFGALVKGCSQKLAFLNLSKNSFSSKKSHKDITVFNSLKSFFSTTVALKSVNLSNSKLSSEALKAILLGLACNESATDVYLNLSSNELKSLGASVIETCLPDIKCLSGIDLSENSFDLEVSNVISAVSRNKSLKKLSIGKNFMNIKPKHMPRTLESLISLLQDEESSLESLSIADSKLRNDTCLIINALSNNHSLISIDIVGNYMSLAGAKTLAKALQVNSKLESIYLDKNHIPTSGFIDIAYALERNFTLRYLPLPIQDINLALKLNSSDKTEAAINKISELLRRNNTSTAIFRNQKLVSTFNSHLNSNQLHHHPDSRTYQLIDKLIMHLQNLLDELSSKTYSKNDYKSKSANILSNSNDSLSESKIEAILKIENYLKDAENAKSLFSKLYSQFIQSLQLSFESNHSLMSTPIKKKVANFVDEFKSVLEAQIQETTALMLKCVQEQCPNIILSSEKLQNDLKNIHSNSINSKHFPKKYFLENCIIEQIGSMINSKIEDVLFSIATSICDRILDEIIELLSSSHCFLTQETEETFCIKRSSTPDVLRNRSNNFLEVRSVSRDSLLESNQPLHSSKNKEENVLATPNISNQKRQNFYTRRMRPQSVMDNVNKEDIPDLLIKSESIEVVNNSILGSISTSHDNSPTSDKLRHLSKYRPKRYKTRPPSKAIATVNQPKNNYSNCNVNKLDEGLDSFFRKPISAEPNKPILTSKNSIFKSLVSHFVGYDKSRSSQKSSPNEEISSSLFAETSTSTSSHLITSKLEEVTRSHSSPNLNNKKQLISQPSGNGNVGSVVGGGGIFTTSTSPQVASFLLDETVAITPNVECRVGSPVPFNPTSDILAEMKAKRGKLSLTNSSISQEEPAPVISSSSQMSQSLPSSNFSKIKLRASAFGEVLKSQSKNSLVSDDLNLEISKSVNNSKVSVVAQQTGTAILHPTATNQSKQRPKSIVGMLGAKFESSTFDSSTDSLSDSNETSSQSDKIKEQALVSIEEGKMRLKKTMAMFSGNSFPFKNSSSSDSETKSLPSKTKVFASSSFHASSILSSLNSKSSSNV